MFRWLSILGALLLAVFTGGVFYFSLRESAVWNEAAGNVDERGMPAVFDGFVERWNRSVERELRRELAAGEQQRELLTVSRGEGDGCRLAERERSVERLRRRLEEGDHIRVLPLEKMPSGLEWHTGMEEPEIGDPRAVKGGQVRLWINTPFPGALRAFGPGSENFFNYSAIDNVWIPLVGLHPETFRPIPGLADRWAVSADGRTVFYHLDPEAAYSDGRPVRAEDFLLNICLRTSDAARDPFWTALFRSTFDRITVYGDSVIALTVPSPRPLLPYMACVDFHPAHPGFYHDFNALFLERYQWKAAPNTGGYMVVPGKIRQGERITLARVKSWWAKDRKYYRYSCNADQVEHVFVNLENKAIEMFRRGDLDMMNIRKPEIWEGKLELPEVHRGYIDKYSLEAGYACPPYGLYLNCSDGMLRNTDIRKGLAHAVNMGMVIDSLFRGNMRRLGSYMEGYGDLTLPLKAPEYSKKKAMEYFARAGFREMGEDGILKNERGARLCLELTFADSSHVMTNVCSIIRQEALKCGVALKLDPLTYSVCSRKVFEKRYQAALWAWPLDTPFPRLYETFASELAYDGRGNSVGNTNNIFAVADAELDAALDVEREAPDYPALKEALHRAQKRIHDLCIWIPGWREPYTHIACWRWIRWPESPTRFCSPRLYNPLESHLYWVDDKMKKETQDARRRGIPFEERHEVIRLKDRDDPLRPSSGE